MKTSGRRRALVGGPALVDPHDNSVNVEYRFAHDLRFYCDVLAVEVIDEEDRFADLDSITL